MLLIFWHMSTCNITKSLNFCFSRTRILKGVITLTAYVGLWFLRYTAVANVSVQNLCGNFEVLNT